MNGMIHISGIIGLEYSLENLIVDVEKNKDSEQLTFLIDSVGGFVKEGFAMASYIANLKKPTVGLGKMVYSIANMLYFSTDKREYYEGGEFMLHNSWVDGVSGNKAELSEHIEEMARIDQRMMDVVMNATGISPEALSALMSKDSYISAEDAKELGFYNTSPKLNFVAMSRQTDLNLINMSQNKDKQEKKNLLKQLAGFLNLDIGAKAMDFTLEDGETTIFVETESADMLEGMSTNAPDGTHTLQDGRVIVVADGIIESVSAPSAEEGEEMDLAKENEELKSRVADLERKLSEYDNTAMEDENKALKAKLSDLESKVNGVEEMKAELKELKDSEEVIVKLAKGIESYREKFPSSPIFNQGEHNTEQGSRQEPTKGGSLSKQKMKEIREKNKK